MLNASIRDIPIPARMAGLPVNERGFPVPWFVAKVNGEWDFRAISGDKIAAAYHRHLCWLCGGPLGQYRAFVIGPMCSVNRVSSEPPCHLECARYAVKACPFLSQPRMRRNEKDIPDHNPVPGVMLKHNPGAVAIWVVRSVGSDRGFRPIKDRGGVLFQIGEPQRVEWYCEGREATREDIQKSFDKGLPFLRDLAAKEGDEAVRELDKMLATAMKLIPA